MKYLFILGRNPELSIQELKAYFEKEGIKITYMAKKRNSVLIEIDKELIKGVINKLGGVISIGEVIASGNVSSIIKELDKKELYLGEKNKFNYVIWDFSIHSSGSIEEISDYLKQRFRSEKLKTTQKNITGIITLQSGKRVPNLASPLIEKEYFLFEDVGLNKNENSNGDKEGGECYFGIIKEKCNYEEIESRDMEKPVRRESLSISPRLSKIMVNLSQVKENETLLDPFCGIGGILQEALLQEIKVIGIDKNSGAIDGANKNLSWFKFRKENYKLINGDSRNIKVGKINGIVSEPDLGQVLKKIPRTEQANKTVKDFEDLIIKVINNFKNSLSFKERIVFTSPLIKTISGRLSCNSARIIEHTQLKLVEGFPIDEFREDQIVGRSILVLKR